MEQRVGRQEGRGIDQHRSCHTETVCFCAPWSSAHAGYSSELRGRDGRTGWRSAAAMVDPGLRRPLRR